MTKAAWTYSTKVQIGSVQFRLDGVTDHGGTQEGWNLTTDLTPDEARQLGIHLIHAGNAAEQAADANLSLFLSLEADNFEDLEGGFEEPPNWDGGQSYD